MMTMTYNSFHHARLMLWCIKRATGAYIKYFLNCLVISQCNISYIFPPLVGFMIEV